MSAVLYETLHRLYYTHKIGEIFSNYWKKKNENRWRIEGTHYPWEMFISIFFLASVGLDDRLYWGDQQFETLECWFITKLDWRNHDT